LQVGVKQLRAADLLLLGRVTYPGMAAYWPGAQGEIADLMNHIPKVVSSRTLEAVDWNNTRLLSGDPRLELPRLKQEGSGNMFLFGSAQT